MPQNLPLPGCGTKPQVAVQKAEAVLLVGTCIHLMVAALTTHHLVEYIHFFTGN